MFRVVTVAREYGSGGAGIAQLLADRLDWKLLDRCLVEKIAQVARVEPKLAEQYDESPIPGSTASLGRFGKQVQRGAPWPAPFPNCSMRTPWLRYPSA